jgi:hypothetical protein
MKRILLLAIVLSLGVGVRAANLTNILIANGTGSIPCDGLGHWTPILPLHAAVVRAYLFFSMSPNGTNGADVMLGDPNLGNYPLAEIHLLKNTPSQGIQGEDRENYAPNSVWTEEAGAIAVCWGGGSALLYADVWVDLAIPHP